MIIIPTFPSWRTSNRGRAQAIAKQLKQTGRKATIFIGEYALSHPQAAAIRTLARLISHLTGATLGILTDGANSAGAWLSGAVPHRGPGGVTIPNPGANAYELLTTNPKRAYFLLGLKTEMDCVAPAAALETLRQAGLVVCLTSFVTAKMEEYADFILPIVPMIKRRYLRECFGYRADFCRG